MKVRAISLTDTLVGEHMSFDAENLMVYCARVSSPHNQDNHATGEKLLRYCFDNGHWSVFEMADFTVEIETSIAVSRQLLRHKSFSFQEFSQRYADASQLGIEQIQLRSQDKKNRQNSIDNLTVSQKQQAALQIQEVLAVTRRAYEALIQEGVAKECARMILPMCTTTRLYAKNNVRGWIHYFQVRRHKSTQKEHRDLAEAMFQEFKKYFPVCAGMLEEVK